mgnify:CR=1 FL=1
MATSVILVVNVKKDGNYKLFKSSNIKNETKPEERFIKRSTKLNITKASGKLYYISDLKRWIQKSDVEQNEKKTKAEVTKNSVKAKFKNKNAMIVAYKTEEAQNPIENHKAGNQTYTITQYSSNGRVYIKEWGQWVRASLLDTETITGLSKNQKTAKQKVTYYTNAVKKSEASAIKGLTDFISTPDTLADKLPVKTPIGIYGIPYQFSENVDSKLDGTTFGQYYADRVISRMPLLVLSPGKVSFMKASSDSDRATAIQQLVNSFNGADSDLTSFLTTPGKYYTFEYNADDYWEYVNTMNQACATYLGIQDVKIKINNYEAKLASFKWEKAVSSDFGSWLQSKEDFVTFYADSDSTTGEDFSNTTTQSMIAGTLNKSSDIGKEIRFLMGEDGVVNDFVNSETINKALDQIDQLAGSLTGSESNIISQLSKEFAVIATGGKLIFPEIWDDSSFTKDFDCKIKLRCPCPNPLGWFLDICVPLNHLLAFTMPRTPHGNDIAGQLLSSDVTANGYFSPFLVRGFYKGIASVDMGIVTSLRIDKGKEGSWTVDGLPTEVDVSMTIKDLYTAMAMTPYKRHADLLNNTQYLSYLAFNCGVALNQPDVYKSVKLYGSVWNTDIYKNIIKDTLTGYNFWRRAKQNVQNKLTAFWRGNDFL